MTVKEAQAIVRAEYPQAIAGIVRNTGWIAVKAYPFGFSVGPCANTAGEAWKKCAEHMERDAALRETGVTI